MGNKTDSLSEKHDTANVLLLPHVPRGVSL